MASRPQHPIGGIVGLLILALCAAADSAGASQSEFGKEFDREMAREVFRASPSSPSQSEFAKEMQRETVRELFRMRERTRELRARVIRKLNETARVRAQRQAQWDAWRLQNARQHQMEIARQRQAYQAELMRTQQKLENQRAQAAVGQELSAKNLRAEEAVKWETRLDGLTDFYSGVLEQQQKQYDTEIEARRVEMIALQDQYEGALESLVKEVDVQEQLLLAQDELQGKIKELEDHLASREGKQSLWPYGFLAVGLVIVLLLIWLCWGRPTVSEPAAIPQKALK